MSPFNKVTKLLGFIAWTATLLMAQSPTWSKSTVTTNPPYFNGYLNTRYNSYNGVTMMYITDNLGGPADIYSNSLWFFDSAAQALTKLGASGSTGASCGTGSATWPHDRHPVGQIWDDPVRHRLWILQGVCNTVMQQDMWYYQYSSGTLSGAVWTQVTPTHLPNGTFGLHGYESAAIVHDSTDDVFLAFGYDGNANSFTTWVYCDTSMNPTPGTLTTLQSAAGCSVNGADDWSSVTLVGGTFPNATNFPAMVYDSVNKKVVLFGGLNGGLSPLNETWAYDVPTKTWVNKAPSNPPPYNSVPMSTPGIGTNMAFVPSSGLVYVHVPANPSDYTYNFANNTWSSLGNLGGPTQAIGAMVYDSSKNALIVNNNGASSVFEIWIGQFPAPSSSGSAHGGSSTFGGKLISGP